MKNLVYICLSLVIIIGLFSCGSKTKESDLKTETQENTTKMLKMHQDYSECAIKAAKDSNLDEGEIEELNKIATDIETFSKKLESKYEKDTVAQNMMMELLKTEGNKKIIKNYNDALLTLYKCNGSEYLY